jgi:hypothetical protein
MIKKLKKAKYKIDDTRIKLKFAWFPKRIRELNNVYLIWFEYYYSFQKYRSWFDNTSGSQGIYWEETSRTLYKNYDF